MILESFTDELLSLNAGRGVIVKTASKSRLFERFGAIGGAAGLGSHGLAHGKAALTENPWDAPRDTTTEAGIKGLTGGLTAAAALKLLGMLATKGKRR